MDFKKAIAVALDNAKELLPGAKEFTLEGAIISDNNYEITLSYYLTGDNPLELPDDNIARNNLFNLAKLMGTRREYKIFIVGKHQFEFKGFKVYKEK
ncbi:hypothetical protein [Collimonas pratensis]|uniref:Uncharacterized protein n=1 Tax=Collimonas pratensis TaxID=279113 RepID=A0ABM5Z981_9BURK|nr:hypothetical protein [Collimonas pratensis]AMP15504.1 hypothetical protein CPter291_3267 [Collimonas pratensis]